MSFGNPIAETPNVDFRVGDIRDPQAVDRALKGVSDVIHLAGIVTDDLADMNKALAYSVNVRATRDMVDDARLSGVTRFIYASSSSVYGSQLEDATETMEPKPTTFYAETKLEAEGCVLDSNGDFFTTTAVRCATCMGPAPRMRLDTIVNIFTKQAYFDSVIEVHDGTQWRSNVHVKDAAEFYIQLLDEPHAKIAGQVFNITDENKSALVIAQTVREVAEYVLNRPIQIRIRQDIRDERQYRMSYQKAYEVLGWTPKRGMAKAVREVIEFFKVHPDVDFNADLWYNTRRMKDIVTKEA